MSGVPDAYDSQRAVNGAILLNRDAISAVADWLEPGDFSDEAQRAIYQAALDLWQARTPPDVRTIREQLRKAGKLDQIGGITMLASLSDDVPTAYHIAYYAKAVAEASRRRRLFDASGKLARLSCDEDRPVDEVEAEAQRLILQATERRNDGGLVSIAASIDQLSNDLASETSPAIPTGWADLDAVLTGYQPGHLWIAAGRPGMGKSAFAATLALQAAQAGHRIQIYSLEMPRDEYTMRLVSLEANVPFEDIRARRMNDIQSAAVARAMGVVHALAIAIDDTGNLPVARLRARAMRDIAKHGRPALIVVDYLQLVRVPGSRGEYEEVSEVSRSLKVLAKEAQCTVLGLAQLNREALGVPSMHHLRSSGQIEQDADAIMFPYRPELHDTGAPKGEAVVIIGKQRGGRSGVSVPAVFDGPTMAYRPRSTYSAPEGY